ncbi:hypothetical protein TNCT_466771 [Trichonephila clavata]|uniref:C2H2-type domain-containing protein n=1 Tax=Trichonephila clavata TaxID=2740835 RepID=A0A8X6JPH0_TRICU|nr:hypothetical protein TNCT_466771 [Trichonephila clavata]
MDQSAGEYRCYPCKLHFKHYKQFLSHKYLSHDEQDLQPEINHNGESSQISSSNYKRFSEMHIGKIPLKKQLKCKDSSEDVYNSLFDSSDRDTNQFRYDTLFESTAMPSMSKIDIGHIQDSGSRHHSNSERKANEISLSLKSSIKEICRLERNPHVNTSQSSTSSECSQMEMHTHEMGEQFNRNQSSKYSQL